jgi:4-hydroxybutyrate CoA-transferase
VFETVRDWPEACSRLFYARRAGVVTTRGDIYCVVTEFGVAQLYGKSLRQRARALIDTADLRFRETLERAARERYLL